MKKTLFIWGIFLLLMTPNQSAHARDDFLMKTSVDQQRTAEFQKRRKEALLRNQTEVFLRGDLNQDGTIDQQDWRLLDRLTDLHVDWLSRMDINHNEHIDDEDLQMLSFLAERNVQRDLNQLLAIRNEYQNTFGTSFPLPRDLSLFIDPEAKPQTLGIQTSWSPGSPPPQNAFPHFQEELELALRQELRGMTEMQLVRLAESSPDRRFHWLLDLLEKNPGDLSILLALAIQFNELHSIKDSCVPSKTVEQIVMNRQILQESIERETTSYCTSHVEACTQDVDKAVSKTIDRELQRSFEDSNLSIERINKGFLRSMWKSSQIDKRNKSFRRGRVKVDPNQLRSLIDFARHNLKYRTVVALSEIPKTHDWPVDRTDLGMRILLGEAILLNNGDVEAASYLLLKASHTAHIFSRFHLPGTKEFDKAMHWSLASFLSVREDPKGVFVAGLWWEWAEPILKAFASSPRSKTSHLEDLRDIIVNAYGIEAGWQYDRICKNPN